MIKAILIIWSLSYGHVEHVEFNSMRACEDAKAAMEIFDHATIGLTFRFLCVSKGAE